ncbi:MAG: hypothetical protein KF889_18620 [Alphaproteobacteria bacterium]|nr:hypothetical protein [Alphaproteobacteria bacterium]MCW5743917.1 hypothetical protein [Alphaproteobacteria bacterium]
MKNYFVRHISAGVLAAGLAVSAIIPVTHATDAPDQSRRLEELVRAFDESAMRVNGSRAQELARWTGTIYLAIADTPGLERVAGEAENMVRTLAAFTRVNVERVAVSDPRRNFLIKASTRESNGRTPCLSAVDWDDWGRMATVEVHVNLTNAARLTRCINHEILHGFGLRSHPETAYSVLSYRYVNQAHLTEIDEVVLATLYDPRVPVTGSMPNIARIACGVMAEKLNMTAAAAEPICARRSAPSRQGLFASLSASGSEREREHIGQ